MPSIEGLLHWLGSQTSLQALELRDNALPRAIGGPTADPWQGMFGFLYDDAEPEPDDPALLQLYAGLVHTSLRHLHIDGAVMPVEAGDVMFAHLTTGALCHLTHLCLTGCAPRGIEASGGEPAWAEPEGLCSGCHSLPACPTHLTMHGLCCCSATCHCTARFTIWRTTTLMTASSCLVKTWRHTAACAQALLCRGWPSAVWLTTVPQCPPPLRMPLPA
jgi:hypothetical protein